MLIGIGIPYIFSFATYPPEELERLGNAIFGWRYHSEEDKWDKLDPELLELHTELYFEYILRLVTTPVVPWDYQGYTSYLIEDVETIQNQFPTNPDPEPLLHIKYKLKTLLQMTTKLNELISNFQIKNDYEISDKERLEIGALNKLILSLGRILNQAFRSVSGKYGHDPYGFSHITFPLPRVSAVLKQSTEL